MAKEVVLVGTLEEPAGVLTEPEVVPPDCAMSAGGSHWVSMQLIF
jgi:hypothetical protein